MCSFRAISWKWQIVALTSIFILSTFLLLLLHGLILRYFRRSEQVAFNETFLILSCICIIFLVSWWPVILSLDTGTSIKPIQKTVWPHPY